MHHVGCIGIILYGDFYLKYVQLSVFVSVNVKICKIVTLFGLFEEK